MENLPRKSGILSVIIPGTLLCFLSIFTLMAQTGNSQETMRSLADKKEIQLGAALMPYQLIDSAFVVFLRNTFNYISPENSLKWDALRPKEDVFAFEEADKLVNFAVANKMKMRGHTLVWHYVIPSWLGDKFKTASKEEMKQVLKTHIQTVVKRYKGKISEWDVCNEVLDENGTLRKSPWLDKLGPEYVEWAFQWAHEADPACILYINDYNTEWVSPKSDALYKYVKELLAKKVPVHGVGFQFHLDGTNPLAPVTQSSIARNMQRFIDLGLKVQITELDVRLKMPATAEALQQQADIYGNLMKIALAVPGCTGYITWGAADDHSWVPSNMPGMGAPLMFNTKFQPKPAAVAVRKALADPRPGKEYLESLAKVPSDTNSRGIPTFRVAKALRTPVIDGKADAAEWDSAYVYPMPFNQLDSKDLRGPSQANLFTSWRMLYSGDTVYGMVTRQDDKTNVNAANPWENDCIEIFYRTSTMWNQIRSIVGKDWDKKESGADKAVWSDDGKVMEFSYKLPTGPLPGQTTGWLIALGDNDGPGRVRQMYAVNGMNSGWMGQHYGEITCQSAKNGFVDGPNMGDVMPFNATAGSKVPVVDGSDSDPVWKEANIYPFAYNQLNPVNQLPPDEKDLSGDWSVCYSGDGLYGVVHRADDKTVTDAETDAKSDNLELALSFNDQNYLLRTVVGKDFSASTLNKAKAVWSADGKTLEFFLPLPTAQLAGKKVKWSIALSDNDGGKSSPIKYKLYSFPGYSQGQTASGTSTLADQMTRKVIDFSELLFVK